MSREQVGEYSTHFFPNCVIQSYFLLNNKKTAITELLYCLKIKEEKTSATLVG